MKNFHKRLGKILSNGLNEKDYFQIKSMNKEQFQKQKKINIERIKSRKLQNDKYILLKGYQKLIKKFNNNLIVLRNVVGQNKKILQMFKNHTKIMNKTIRLKEIYRFLSNIQEMTIFMEDIDDKIVEQIINKG